MVEHLDGHTDIIHKKLHSDWMPWLDDKPSNLILSSHKSAKEHARTKC